jgi:hypothetical protein
MYLPIIFLYIIYVNVIDNVLYYVFTIYHQCIGQVVTLSINQIKVIIVAFFFRFNFMSKCNNEIYQMNC